MSRYSGSSWQLVCCQTEPCSFGDRTTRSMLDAAGLRSRIPAFEVHSSEALMFDSKARRHTTIVTADTAR